MSLGDQLRVHRLKGYARHQIQGPLGTWACSPAESEEGQCLGLHWLTVQCVECLCNGQVLGNRSSFFS